MRRVSRAIAAGMTLAMMLSGCAALRENRDLCLGVAIGTGAALGGTLGGLLETQVAKHGDCCSGGSYNWEVFGASLGGLAGGGLIGWGLGELLCEEPEPPPPPPPPPAKAPPPPPPPTERRGG